MRNQFDCFLDGRANHGIGFSQITLGDHQFDERTRHIDAKMP